MSRTITAINSGDTFGSWVSKTNEILTELQTTIQTGGSSKNAAGNVYINGDISGTGKLEVDTIDILTPTNTLHVQAPLKTDGSIQLDNIDNVSTATGISFKNNNDITWEIFTTDDHASLELGVEKGGGEIYKLILTEGVAPANGVITATNLTIDNDILPANISVENVTATANVTAVDMTVTNTITDSVSDISNHDTSALAEDPSATTTSGTMYFTESRARNAISASGSLTYTAANGHISYTERTDAQIKALITSGTGVNVTDDQVSIGQSVATSDNVTFNKVTAETFDLGSNWTVEASSSKLSFKYNGTTVFSVGTTGDVVAEGNVTAYGSA